MMSRGFSVAEVEEAIRTARWMPAELARLQCEMTYKFGQEWNGRLYARKRVSPVFIETDAEILVVTVYTYYF